MDFRQFELILYDIDGTLVDTGGAGMAAISQAAERYFGAAAPMLDLAGSTDLGIVNHLLEHYQQDFSAIDVAHFFDIYHRLLEEHLSSGCFDGQILPGAKECLEHCAEWALPTGLLTGNSQRGAAIKMQHYQLYHHFPYGAYGDDHADRNLLGPVALQRAGKHHEKSFRAAATLVIGDTPKDIACAHAMGAKCLAVATGAFTIGDLRARGADWVVPTLLDCLG